MILENNNDYNKIKYAYGIFWSFQQHETSDFGSSPVDRDTVIWYNWSSKRLNPGM